MVEADSHAWYATSIWFAKYYGTPDTSISTATTGPDLNYLDLFEDDGSIENPTGYDSPDYDEISADEAIAFDAGDYTPNGWLQNKKLRILPLGGKSSRSLQPVIQL